MQSFIFTLLFNHSSFFCLAFIFIIFFLHAQVNMSSKLANSSEASTGYKSKDVSMGCYEIFNCIFLVCRLCGMLASCCGGDLDIAFWLIGLFYFVSIIHYYVLVFFFIFYSYNNHFSCFFIYTGLSIIIYHYFNAGPHKGDNKLETTKTSWINVYLAKITLYLVFT